MLQRPRGVGTLHANILPTAQMPARAAFLRGGRRLARLTPGKEREGAKRR